MAVLKDDYTGAIGHCDVCRCPMVFVGGNPMATYVGDVLVETVEEFRGTSMVTITPHSALCPNARR